MSMNNSNQQNLCKQGCGFYGTAQNMDMCSKCYQDYMKNTNQDISQHTNPISINDVYIPTKTIQPIISTSEKEDLSFITNESRKRPAQNDSDPNVKMPKISENEIIVQDLAAKIIESPELSVLKSENSRDSSSPGNSQITTNKPRRCQFCRRKVGLTGFDCRCGGHFCAMHRYSDKHSCTFDYQAHGQEQIKNQNPMIVGSKIKKI